MCCNPPAAILEAVNGLKTGFIHVYTGNGKGKTTAALGLALRAAGAGLKVFIGQFLKTGAYSEITALKRFSESITVEQFGETQFIREEPSAKDRQRAAEGLARIQEVLAGGEYDIVILEEINVACSMKLIPVKGVLDLLKNKPEAVEMVLTGRYAAPAVIEAADLVTEMREIKHYYKKGVAARKGIEK